MSEAIVLAHPALTGAQAVKVARETERELVQSTGHYSLEKKRAAAIAYLRSRGKYILDQDVPQPPWGNGPKEAA